MALVLVITFLCLVVVYGCVLALGWEAMSAREYLARAVVLAQEGKLAAAREAAIVACRQNPAYGSHPDVQTLRQIIEKKWKGDSEAELDRIRLAIPQWPRKKWERIVGSVPIRFAVVAVILVEILFKLLQHS